ncbi:MAG: type II and III secretion system family protein [Alphaproteobacteria bacterium]
MFSFRAVKPSPCNTLLKVSCAFLLSFSVVSCDLAANYTKTDRAANLDFQDFRDGMAERLPEAEDDKSTKASAAIPALQPYITTDTQGGKKAFPLVSVSVNQTVPIRDVLYELAQQAEYDLELDPNIRGSIIFTARNKPFDVVIERISDVAGLRYKFEDGFLRVELDSPYNKTYKIDYLSFIRSSTGGVTTSVSVVSGEGADTGSNFSSTMDSTSDFWGELELNLEQIITGASTGALKTNRDPRITAVAQNPEVAAVAPTEGADGQTQVQPPEAVLRVESLPVDGDSATSGAANDEEGPTGSFTINKQAGLVNIYASEKAHEEAEAYLKLLKRAVSSQVLVEAKVFEVSLSDEYITGIDWQALNGEGVGSFLSTAGGTGLNTIDTPSPRVGGEDLVFLPGGDVAALSSFALGWVGNDFQALLRAISGFGTVRALASPRLTVLNNQSAVLNVATNRVFFELDVDRETDDDTGDVTVEIDSEIRSVPEGVLINVQPSIDLDNRTISLSVRPTITRIVGEVLDPSVQFVAGDLGIQSEIPEVNVQEIDTVVKVKSAQPIVMGGLLQDRIVDTQETVPVLGEVPLLGNLFKRQSDGITKTELVIFLKATLIESPDQTIHNTDRDLYRAFSGDRRPFKL